MDDQTQEARQQGYSLLSKPGLRADLSRVRDPFQKECENTGQTWPHRSLRERICCHPTHVCVWSLGSPPNSPSLLTWSISESSQVVKAVGSQFLLLITGIFTLSSLIMFRGWTSKLSNPQSLQNDITLVTPGALLPLEIQMIETQSPKATACRSQNHSPWHLRIPAGAGLSFSWQPLPQSRVLPVPVTHECNTISVHRKHTHIEKIKYAADFCKDLKGDKVDLLNSNKFY